MRQALVNFARNVNEYHLELSQDDKSHITSRLNEWFIDPLSAKIKHLDVVDPAKAAASIRNDFERVLEVIKVGDYVRTNPILLHPTEPPYLALLKETLYQVFLNRMMEDAYEKVKSQIARGLTPDPSAL